MKAVRQAAYSAAIQHGKARDVLREAVLEADGQLKRSDPRYQRVLVEAIYDRRTAYVTKQRNDARAAGRVQRAQVLDRSVVNRYPNERADALQLPGAR